MTEYITQADYRRQKTALTRAINSKDPLKVLVACERVLDAWQGKCWPDDWSRWSVACYDAWLAYERSRFSDSSESGPGLVPRFAACYDRFA